MIWEESRIRWKLKQIVKGRMEGKKSEDGGKGDMDRRYMVEME